MILHFALLVVGIFAPLGLGWLLFAQLYPVPLRRDVRIIASFLVGKSILTITLFIAALFGLPLGWGQCVTVLLILYAILAALCKRPHVTHPEPLCHALETHSRPSRLITAAILGWLLAYGLCILGIAMSEPIGCRPGIAIWGFKAKLIFLDQALPLQYLANPDLTFMQPRYPLGEPLFMAWLYQWMGAVDDYSITMLPPLYAGMACVGLYGILRQEGVARPLCAALTLLMASGQQFYSCAIQFYMEIPLLLHALFGAYFLNCFARNADMRACWMGSLFLAAGAWVKQEGVVIVAAAFIPVVLTAWRLQRGLVLRATGAMIAPVLLFIVPWQWIVWRSGATYSDFFFSRTMITSPDRVQKISDMIATDFYRALVGMPTTHAGAWLLLAVVCVIRCKRFLATRGIQMLLLMLPPIVITYAVVFFFSTLDIRWHLMAAYRILLPPSVIALLAAGMLCARDDNSVESVSSVPQDSERS